MEENKEEVVKSEFYAKFCSTIVSKLSEAGYPDHEMIRGEGTIELLLRKVKNALCGLNSNCFICQ